MRDIRAFPDQTISIMYVPDYHLIQLLQSNKLVRIENSYESDAHLSGKKVNCKTALKWLFATDAQRKRIDKNAVELVITTNVKCKGSSRELYIVGFYLY